MEATAKLIAAIADLIAALIWPMFFLAVFWLFREPIRESSSKLPDLIGRIKRGKVGILEVELEQVAQRSTVEVEPGSSAITLEQIRVATKIDSQAAEIGTEELLRQLDRLSREYDTIRGTQPPGGSRTAALSRVLVQMRALGLSVSRHIERYKASNTAGDRLAAVAMMQIRPEVSDLGWLLERFKGDSPFIFYNAALALENLANNAPLKLRLRVRDTAKEALSVVQSFSDKPDRNTAIVLQRILDNDTSNKEGSL